MAKYQFVATHGVHLSEGGFGPWAHFQHDPARDTPNGEKRYVFETDDPEIARRVRKVDGYGITETSKADVEDVPETPLVVGGPPAGNAPKAAWVEYAASHGMSLEEAKGKSVKELREHFNTQRPVEQETPGQVLVPPTQPRPDAQDDVDAQNV